MDVPLTVAGSVGILAIGLGGSHNRSPRSLFRHPGPAILAAGAAFAWVGAL